MPHATMPTTGFQAIILCGPGESMNPFNSNPKEFPKALIPIANRPMVWYALEWCYRMGITNIHLVTPYESRSAIEAALSQNPYLTSLPSPRPTVIAPETLTLTTGTAEIFRLQEVQDAISADFIMLPCDLICEMNGQSLLEAWMSLQESLGTLGHHRSRDDTSAERAERQGGLGIWYQTKDSAEGGVGVKREEVDFIALTDPSPAVAPPGSASLRPQIFNLAMAMPRASLKDDMEEKQHFAARHALLNRHGRLKLKTTYRDAHVYFLPHWIKDMLRCNEVFENVSEDLIGWWAKAGWQKGLAVKLNLPKVFDQEQQKLQESEKVEDETQVASLSSTFTSTAPADGMSPGKENGPKFASRVGGTSLTWGRGQREISVPPILCYTHPAQPSAPLLRRIDTVALLLSVSLHLAKLPSTGEAYAAGSKPSPFAHPHKVPPTTVLPPQLTLHQPTVLLDANVTLTSKSTIRESVIGANCILGTTGSSSGGVRLSRCLLMEGVVLESGNVLNGCVLGRRCKVGTGCDLRDCYIQEGYMVPGGTIAKGEVFAGFDDGGEVDKEEADLYSDLDEEQTGNIVTADRL